LHVFHNFCLFFAVVILGRLYILGGKFKLSWRRFLTPLNFKNINDDFTIFNPTRPDPKNILIRSDPTRKISGYFRAKIIFGARRRSLVLGFQVRFSGHPNFRFFGIGRLSSLNQMCYQLKICPKNSEI
jgi:hypothetical protein